MDAAKLDHLVAQQLESLRREFADEIAASRVNAVGEAHFDRLRADARIPDFIPVLVYRFAREELLRVGRGPASGGVSRRTGRRRAPATILAGLAAAKMEGS